MLYLVGLGVSKEHITLGALESAKKCDELYLESYTSLGLEIKDLEKIFEKKIVESDRDFIENFDITVEQIRIDRYENQIYYATIYASQKGKLISFDSRPSDATALAFKLDKPVYFNSTILEQQGLSVC